MKLPTTTSRIITSSVLCIFFLLVSIPCSGEEESTKTEPEVAQALSLIEIYSWSNKIPNDLVDLQNQMEGITNVAEHLSRLTNIAAEVDDLEWEIIMAKSDPNISYHQLSSLESRLAKINQQLEVLDTPVKSNVMLLERLYKEWLERQNVLHALRIEAEKQGKIDDVAEILDTLDTLVRNGQHTIEEQIKPNLQAGKEIGEILTQVYVLSDTVSDVIKDMNGFSLQQTSPSMLSPTFYQRLEKKLLQKGWEDLRLFSQYQLRYLNQNKQGVAMSLLAICLLVFVVHASKKLVKASSKWHPFASRPVATAVFIASASFGIINTTPIRPDLPPEWEALSQLPLIVVVAILAKNVCHTPWQSTLLRRVVLLLAVSHLFSIIGLPQLFTYLFVFYISVLGLAYYLYLLRRRWKNSSSTKITWAIWLWCCLPLTIIISGILGYDQFAVYIFGIVLAEILVSLMILLMLEMASGLLECMLLNAPVATVRQNATRIVNQITPALILALGLLWLAITLMVLRIRPTVEAAFIAMTSIELSLFGLKITPGSVLIVVFICYATFVFSRGLRAFLQQTVLPRYGVELGVQVSISRLVHYAILTIGFFVLLKMLGFGLSQITILGGALGVGIGFGLQAIVNNFVSGLILLFERPIKVGDMIEIGMEVGEVKELGLRATIVQTFDNAEVVIPNSELITGRVTNWTLSEKRVRVKLPVGVAYGTDISAVLKILLSCADANPMVLTKPEPKALFLAFGASSLDFELRVWIPDFAEGLVVRSELNQDIEAEFDLAGIEIPFPQTDLHLRSIDEKAIKVLNRTHEQSKEVEQNS
ncbi:mechanosensitive ion channel family protein [Desulfogranum marinum]|uniref:mechanosensitive ion channel family protein n=1 Tax=Desulfogranum marinum TaxID=453220 RepID=UPI001964F6E5|nr:mechanosensitive ion channel domain-containing protein [Desulfogranum marinum]MBM9510968.1 mechanosensitive ion channel [Desulfogranum marinum]